MPVITIFKSGNRIGTCFSALLYSPMSLSISIKCLAPSSISFCPNFTSIKAYLPSSRCNTASASNPYLLEHVPHNRIEDLAITCHVFLDNSSEGLCSTIVNDDLLNAFGISKSQLFHDAVENDERLMPITIQTMTELMESSGISQLDGSAVKTKIPMYIISNALNLNGAASVFYPGVMDEISERCNGDFYLIPSSFHEVLAVPATSDIDVEKLEQTIEFVNETQVYGPDQLGNHLYRYDSKESVLEMVQTPSVIAETLSAPAFLV